MSEFAQCCIGVPTGYTVEWDGYAWSLVRSWAVESVLPSGRFIRKDEPIRIRDFNEPFPDLAVAHGDLENYANRHPGPEDVSLVIEISDATLGKDRGEKRISYGRAGIPVCWIVNLVDRQVEVYSRRPTVMRRALTTDQVNTSPS